MGVVGGFTVWPLRNFSEKHVSAVRSTARRGTTLCTYPAVAVGVVMNDIERITDSIIRENHQLLPPQINPDI